MTYSEIAFDGPLHVRLGQSSPDHSTFRRFSFGDGVHVSRGASHVHDDERSEPGAFVAALGEQTRPFHDGGRRGHQHFVERAFPSGVHTNIVTETLRADFEARDQGRRLVDR